MTNAQAYEVLDMKLVSKTLFTTALLLVAVTAAQAAGDEASAGNQASADRLIRARVEAQPGRTAEMYRVPGGMRLVVTQACVPHPAMQVGLGRDGEKLTYDGAGCTQFLSGMTISSGEALYCSNRSGVSRNCMVIGMLHDDPARGRGAQFIDVDQAIADQK
jgi:hypothetical protein